MTNQNAFERTAALLNELIDSLLRAEERAPHSPVESFAPAKMRRAMRRSAERLRRGEIQPRYKNLYTAEQLADLYEQTAQRDEIRQKALDELNRIGRQIGRLLDEDPQESRNAFELVYLGTWRQAKKQGPDSEAARRYRQLQRLTHMANVWRSDRRRQKSSNRPHEAHDDGNLIPMIPAEILESAPAGEAVLLFPALETDGESSRHPRILIRFGIGASSWIGSFEVGLNAIWTAFMMPDNKHLFVSAGGAGYILDARSRALVERTGSEIVGVMRDPEMTRFIVNHNNERFEVFGPEGRLTD